MKKYITKHKTAFKVILGILALFIILAIFSNEERTYDKNRETTYSSKDYGAKVLFYSTLEYGKDKGFDCVRHNKYARFIDDKSMVICIAPMIHIYEDYELSAIYRQISEGSTYMIISDTFGLPDLLANIGNEKEVAKEDNITFFRTVHSGNVHFDEYTLGEGRLLVSGVGVENYLNKATKKDKSTVSYTILMIGNYCNENSYETVYFNEFYRGIEKSPLPDIVGWGLLLMTVELGIALVVFLLYKGKRFGAPEVVFANIKRNETENVFALAGLYRRTGSANIIFTVQAESFFDDLCNRMSIGEFNNSLLPEIQKYVASEDNLKDKGIGEIIEIYSNIDNIKLSYRKAESLVNKIEKIREGL